MWVQSPAMCDSVRDPRHVYDPIPVTSHPSSIFYIICQHSLSFHVLQEKLPRAISVPIMSTFSPPPPSLRPRLASDLCAYGTLLVGIILYIPLMTVVAEYVFLGEGAFEQPTEISVSFESIILFVFMIGPYLFNFYSGYHSINIRIPYDQDKEWATDFESSLKILVETPRFPSTSTLFGQRNGAEYTLGGTSSGISQILILQTT